MVRSFVKQASIFCTLTFSINNYANDISFKEFVKHTLSAKTANLSQAEVETLLPHIKQFKKIGVASEPEEFNISFENYLKQVSQNDAIELLYSKHQDYSDQLKAISKHYSVQPRFIVALWGVLSNFGDSKPDYPALSVYASKAYSDPTSPFKQELVAVVASVKSGHVSLEEISSDFQGNLGFLSITPSFYNQYAVDWDKDGKKDIWHNHLDSFATIANFLYKQGWDHSATWGRQVKLSRGLDQSFDFSKAHSFKFWSELGLTKFNGRPLPNRADIQAKLLKVPNSKGRYYLTYKNFDVMEKWPQMDDYRLLSVMYLSERLNKRIKGF
ncbi:hypothetical protein D5018_03100 [Parashewanella curva]|uniref:Transglycosylase SLT domain-containing protein n=1 Tax=Parashewanella curva TaxID=2338552 RepID=A0A3L8Q1C2_9GAMM|nr:lytic murein transglycosylase [Parashewanella curva]RLV61260.1 hypothetical protein D5018_03100 [Parashewanella curva]